MLHMNLVNYPVHKSEISYFKLCCRLHVSFMQSTRQANQVPTGKMVGSFNQVHFYFIYTVGCFILCICSGVYA